MCVGKYRTMENAVKEVDKYLHSIYFNPEHPASFSGVDKLYKFVKERGRKISRGVIKRWLGGQSIYNQHKPVRRTFKRQRVVVPRKWFQFDMDTVYMTSYQKDNVPYKFILVVIDVFSKFAWTRALKTLTGKEMVTALSSILSREPDNMRTDGGSEFVNNQVKKFMESNQIKHFVTLNEKKANVAERFIKTLKTRITKYMHQQNSHKWVKVLPKVTEAYNQSYHHSINTTPAKALETDDVTLWNTLYPPPRKRVKRPARSGPARNKNPYKFNEGDLVKLSYLRTPFAKHYDSKWTDEIFTITGRRNKQTVPQYSIKDFTNSPIRGMFYEEEIQKVYIPQGKETRYKIDKIIKTRSRNNVKESFVSWVGWPSSFNTWLPVSEIRDI